MCNVWHQTMTPKRRGLATVSWHPHGNDQCHSHGVIDIEMLTVPRNFANQHREKGHSRRGIDIQGINNDNSGLPSPRSEATKNRRYSWWEANLHKQNAIDTEPRLCNSLRLTRKYMTGEVTSICLARCSWTSPSLEMMKETPIQAVMVDYQLQSTPWSTLHT